MTSGAGGGGLNVGVVPVDPPFGGGGGSIAGENLTWSSTAGFATVVDPDVVAADGADSIGNDKAVLMLEECRSQLVETAGMFGAASSTVAAPDAVAYGDAPYGSVVAFTWNGPAWHTTFEPVTCHCIEKSPLIAAAPVVGLTVVAMSDVWSSATVYSLFAGSAIATVSKLNAEVGRRAVPFESIVTGAVCDVSKGPTFRFGVDSVSDIDS